MNKKDIEKLKRYIDAKVLWADSENEAEKQAREADVILAEKALDNRANYVDSRTPEERANEPETTITTSEDLTELLDKQFGVEDKEQWSERFDEMIEGRLGGYADQILYREKDIKQFIKELLIERLNRQFPVEDKEQSSWEERFERVIRKDCGNLEITYGEQVDGTYEPIKQFIKELIQEERTALREMIAGEIKRWHIRCEDVEDFEEWKKREKFNTEVSYLINSVLQDLLTKLDK